MNLAQGKELRVLPVHILKENLFYDPFTGIFTRRISNCNKVKIGDTAGSMDGNGYILININGKSYRAHRLAWLYMTEKMPEELIDHKNGVRHDNRFCNLREATHNQNLQNQTKLPKHNTTGFLGVSFKKRDKKYKAQIKTNGKVKSLGVFLTAEEAHEAYLKAKREKHEFCTI